MQVKVKELGKVYPFLQTYSHLPWDTTELFTLSVLSLPIKKQATFSIPDPSPSTWKDLTPPTHFSGNLLTSHGPVWLIEYFSLDGSMYEGNLKTISIYIYISIPAECSTVVW